MIFMKFLSGLRLDLHKKKIDPKKNAKNCPEKQEKGGKIIFMDFTARLKSCSTKTKFHNFFKSYRKVA